MNNSLTHSHERVNDPIRYYWIIRVLLILIPVTALGYFGYQYINPSGVLEVEYTFCDETTPYVSGLSPHGRVLELDPNTCWQKMVIDPVYFDIRVPQSYRTATVELLLDIEGEQPINVGVGVDPDNWKWHFGEENITSQFNLQEWLPPSDKQKPLDLDLYTTTLNLMDAQFKDNRYRFIVSAPGLDATGGFIMFRGMRVTFEKPPLTGENAWYRIRSMIGL